MNLKAFLLWALVWNVHELRIVKHSDRNKSKSDVSQKRSTYPAMHHDYQSMTEELQSVVASWPDLTRLYSIGKSVEGRDIWVLEVTVNPGIHIPLKPEFKYVANMHGNEVTGKEMLLILARYLCSAFSTIPSIRFLLQNTRIHLMPSMNPDGYQKAYDNGGQDWLLGRNNANNVDLNRNFPDQHFPVPTPLQPETMAVIRWTQSIPFVLSGNLHGGSLVVNYPFDDNPENIQQYSPTPDDDIFRHLASVYSESHPTMHLDNPIWECPDIPQDFFSRGITNGAAWYPVVGSLQDWTYLKSNCFDVTIEIGCRKFPKFEELPKFWDQNREAMIGLIAEIQRGIKGLVMTENGGRIQFAEICVGGRNHIVHSTQYGDYFRILLPGIYNVTVSKIGYIPESRVVEVSDNLSKIVNFTLRQDPYSNPVGHNIIHQDLADRRTQSKSEKSIFRHMFNFRKRKRKTNIEREYQKYASFDNFISEKDEA